MKRTAIREYIEWTNFRWNDAVTAGKPRILLIGDSIVVGHGEPFFELVKDRYSVDTLATAKCVSDVHYRTELDYMLKLNSYEVIVFNNGLHGFEIEDAIYSYFLRETMKYLKGKTKKLFWRNSTPQLEPQNYSNLHPERADRIALRNTTAAQYAKELDIPVIDLYRPMLRNRLWFLPDGVHYTEEGRAKQAELLLSALQEHLAQ